MTPSGALLNMPAAEPTGEKDALQATAQLLTESLKDLDLAERVERSARDRLRTAAPHRGCRPCPARPPRRPRPELSPETDRSDGRAGRSGNPSSPQ